MLSFTNLALRRGPNLLFEDASFVIHRDKKVGLIGSNGAGKTSLFKMITGELDVEEGYLDYPHDLRISYLAQEVPGTDEVAVQYVLEGDKQLIEIQEKIRSAEENERFDELGELHAIFNSMDGHAALSKAEQLMIGLGFSQEDLKKTNIGGDDSVIFTPNTITYAVPAGSDIARRIARAKLGIVFHTKYSGKTMSSLTAGFGSIKGQGPTSVFLASAAFTDTSGSATFNKSELSRFDALIRMAQGSLSKAKPILDEMSKTSMSDQISVGYRLKTYFNHFIRNSNSSMDKVAVMQKQFRDYFESVLQNEIDSRKTPKGKEKFIKAKKDGLQFIDRNKQALYFAIASHISLGNAKNFLIQKLNQVQSIGHFLRTPTGYKVTAPEGFVAVDRVAGAIKLVDRLEFSRANFTIAKDWVKG